jgi:pimeloyl-ACP methyl ester carboxylesterase
MGPLSASLVARAAEMAAADGEFRECTFDWTGSVRLTCDASSWLFTVDRGQVSAAPADAATPADYAVTGSAGAWDLILTAPAPPGYTDFPGTGRAHREDFGIEPFPRTASQQNALRRLSELLRYARNGTDPAPATLPNEVCRHGQHEARVGRYLHLDLDGVDHAVYYEEAGSGIPLLCQHTAGSDGRQWRHLLEDERVTSKYRVISYDLPYHGKSLPPESVSWWAQEYLLTTASAMAVPVALARALGFDRPVFIGSSVGGMLGLDLARYHPDDFRAVICLEAGLKVPDGEAADRRILAERYADTAHWAAQMWDVMAQTAPEAYRHETRLHYAQGAPGVFAGDSHYFLVDHDLTGEAHLIDTSRCPVYLLTGEYDVFTIPMTIEAGRQIKGATVQIMEGLGHFPMSEDHEKLMEYVLPVLDEIAGTD